MVNFRRQDINLATVIAGSYAPLTFLYRACTVDKNYAVWVAKRQYSLQNGGRSFDERSASFVYTDLKLILSAQVLLCADIAKIHKDTSLIGCVFIVSPELPQKRDVMVHCTGTSWFASAQNTSWYMEVNRYLENLGKDYQLQREMEEAWDWTN